MTAHLPRVLWVAGQPRAICHRDCDCWWRVVPNHGQFTSVPKRRAA